MVLIRSHDVIRMSTPINRFLSIDADLVSLIERGLVEATMVEGEVRYSVPIDLLKPRFMGLNEVLRPRINVNS